MPIQYLAGIIDGEGHFCRPRNKSGQGRYSWESRIIVTNTSFDLMNAIKASYGGSIRLRTRSKTNNLPCYVWTLTRKKAEALALRLQPHLIVKSEQVKRLMPPYPGYGVDGRVLNPIYETNRLQASRRKA